MNNIITFISLELILFINYNKVFKQMIDKITENQRKDLRIGR